MAARSICWLQHSRTTSRQGRVYLGPDGGGGLGGSAVGSLWGGGPNPGGGANVNNGASGGFGGGGNAYGGNGGFGGGGAYSGNGGFGGCGASLALGLRRRCWKLVRFWRRCRDGGAIFSNGGTINITNSTFNGNSASRRHGSKWRSGLGGVIFARNGSVNDHNSTLSGNTPLLTADVCLCPQ